MSRSKSSAPCSAISLNASSKGFWLLIGALQIRKVYRPLLPDAAGFASTV